MKVYPHWTTDLPEAPPRSRLYNLKPVGIGTAEVESLAGYIARLAEAHCLAPSTLLAREVTSFEANACWGINTGIHPQLARRLNGIGSKPHAFAKALEALTSCPDIRYTTMASYAGLLSHHQLMRQKRAWCAECLAEWMRSGKTVYEPLLWSIAAVTFCRHHRSPLVEACPHCGDWQRPISSSMRPGYCVKCRRWLGVDAGDGGRNTTAIDEELRRRLWITETIGELLAAAPHLPVPPTQEDFISRLEFCIEHSAWGSINYFSHNVDIWHGSVRRLLKGQVLPTMALLLQICSKLDLPLVALVAGTKDIALDGADNVHGRLVHRAKEPHLLRGERMSFTEVGSLMRDAVSENPPPAAQEIKRRTGHRGRTLRRWYPDLYTRIIERHLDFHRAEYIRDDEAEAMLRAALKENPPPPLQSVFRRLGCRSTGYRYYERFPELCRAVAARYRQRRNRPFDLEEVRRLMGAALSEVPPPSFSEIVRRFDHRREFIRRKLPDLSTAVVTRYKSYLHTSREQNKKLLLSEVEKVIRSLMAEGLCASQRRVLDRMPRHWNGANFKQALVEVKQKLGLLR